MAGGHELWFCLHEGGQQPKQGWGCPQMQQCGVAFLFTSLPDTSSGPAPAPAPALAPAALALHSQAEDSGVLG